MITINIYELHRMEDLEKLRFKNAEDTYEAEQFCDDLRTLTDMYNNYEREQKRRHNLYIEGRVCTILDTSWERFEKFYNIVNNRTHGKLAEYLEVLWEHSDCVY